MASITKRGNSFRVRIFRHELSAITKTFTSEPEALKWMRLIEVQLEQGTFIEEPKIGIARLDMSFVLAAEQYMQSHALRKANHRSVGYRLRILSTRWVDRRLDSITKFDVASLRDDLLKLGRSGSTINHYINTLSQLHQVATNEWGLNTVNPVKGIKRFKEAQGRMKRLPPAAEQTFVEVCRQSTFKELAELVTFAIETGMRRGEILSMRWEDIDLINRRVLLRHTKNGDSRLVPLSSKATNILASLDRSLSEIIAFPFKDWYLRKYFIRAVKTASEAHQGANNPFIGIRFHDLRHEALSRLSDGGLNVMEIAHISGHKTLTMLRRYTHPCHQTLLGKLDKIDNSTPIHL